MNKTLVVAMIAAACVAQAQEPAPLTASRDVEHVLFQLMGRPVVSVGNVEPIQGRPFSATEVNSSVQTLSDGTRIENKTTSKLYRDVDGRTRVEAENGTITITDPVAAFRVTLNPQNKTATRVPGRPVVHATSAAAITPYRIESIRPQGTGKEVREGLGTQSINGASAVGERVTITIPKGQIGNDRDMTVAMERWYSDDLRMLVKSVNNDPRYGESVYELTNITLANPDPSLFLIPSDYRVIESGGRGRSPAYAPSTAIPGAAPVK